MTWQMRSKNYHDKHQWFDLEEGSSFFSGEYELRKKPKEKKPKYYRHEVTGSVYPRASLPSPPADTYEPVRVKKWKTEDES